MKRNTDNYKAIWSTSATIVVVIILVISWFFDHTASLSSKSYVSILGSMFSIVGLIFVAYQIYRMQSNRKVAVETEKMTSVNFNTTHFITIISKATVQIDGVILSIRENNWKLSWYKLNQIKEQIIYIRSLIGDINKFSQFIIDIDSINEQITISRMDINKAIHNPQYLDIDALEIVLYHLKDKLTEIDIRIRQSGGIHDSRQD